MERSPLVVLVSLSPKGSETPVVDSASECPVVGVVPVVCGVRGNAVTEQQSSNGVVVVGLSSCHVASSQLATTKAPRQS
jgi:hypothetical protein